GGPFELTSHRGETVDNARLAGKPYLAFFGFTHCPDVCPTTLFELTDFMRELGPAADRFNVLFFTVDPERDTQDLL
ncbi:SCO family protein, partial [Acinetobacter baumannii]